jgi:hypothetical protein
MATAQARLGRGDGRPPKRTATPTRRVLKSFIGEAKLLARFDHPSLLKRLPLLGGERHRLHGDAALRGPDPRGALAELDHVPGEAELRAWLKPILNAVSLLHDGGVWHQNIGPDTIVLTAVGPVLFGLGSAEQAIARSSTRPRAALKPGFAAIEQYGSPAETKRGAWTDLYALAAVIYAAITGAAPGGRGRSARHDPVRPLSLVAAGLYGERFLAAIDAAMAVEPERRPQDHHQFRAPDGRHRLAGSAGAGAAARPDARAVRRRRRRPRDHRSRPSAARHRRPADEGRRRRRPPRAKAPREAPAARARRRRHAVAAGAARAVVGRRSLGANAVRQARRSTAGRRHLRADRHRAPSRCSSTRARRSGRRRRRCRRPRRRVSRRVAAFGPGASRRRPPRATATPRPLPPPSCPGRPAGRPPHPTARPPHRPRPRPDRGRRPPRRRRRAAAGPADELAPPGTPAERQARCTEILQKASLASLTPAETVFFKRECK